jgi:hypothetical protein
MNICQSNTVSVIKAFLLLDNYKIKHYGEQMKTKKFP